VSASERSTQNHLILSELKCTAATLTADSPNPERPNLGCCCSSRMSRQRAPALLQRPRQHPSPLDQLTLEYRHLQVWCGRTAGKCESRRTL